LKPEWWGSLGKAPGKTCEKGIRNNNNNNNNRIQALSLSFKRFRVY
jgi:hypothetical protein